MERMKVGFLGAGGIAVHMAETIRRMDCAQLYSVAARDLNRAQKFAGKYGIPKAYGSYEELLSDPDVELVYIATPISHHYEHAKLCIAHNKHILCEKAFTSNAAQAEEILASAKKKNLLLTEAIWTRYMPISRTINELLKNGIIGNIHALNANLGYPVSHKPRMVSPELAGGALADIGVYPLNFALMCLGDDIREITSSAILTDLGVDTQNSVVLTYASGVMAVLYSTMLTATDRRGIIYGSEGYMVVDNINNPQSVRVFGPDWIQKDAYQCPGQISGYEYEVESAIKAIRAGAVECPEMPHAETLRVMRILDQLRDAWGVVYPR